MNVQNVGMTYAWHMNDNFEFGNQNLSWSDLVWFGMSTFMKDAAWFSLIFDFGLSRYRATERIVQQKVRLKAGEPWNALRVETETGQNRSKLSTDSGDQHATGMSHASFCLLARPLMFAVWKSVRYGRGYGKHPFLVPGLAIDAERLGCLGCLGWPMLKGGCQCSERVTCSTSFIFVLSRLL